MQDMQAGWNTERKRGQDQSTYESDDEVSKSREFVSGPCAWDADILGKEHLGGASAW